MKYIVRWEEIISCDRKRVKRRWNWFSMTCTEEKEEEEGEEDDF